MELNGRKVFISPTYKEEVEVQRTWSQRLFSRPWRPWNKITKVKQLKNSVLDGEIVVSKEGLIMAEETYLNMRDKLKEE